MLRRFASIAYKQRKTPAVCGPAAQEPFSARGGGSAKSLSATGPTFLIFRPLKASGGTLSRSDHGSSKANRPPDLAFPPDAEFSALAGSTFQPTVQAPLPRSLRQLPCDGSQIPQWDHSFVFPPHQGFLYLADHRFRHSVD